MMHSDDDDALTAEGAARRRFLYGTGALTTGLATSVCLAPAAMAAGTTSTGACARGRRATVPVRLNVNGHDYDLALDPRVTLLDALREYIGADRERRRAATAASAARARCSSTAGAINACLTLAVAHAGDRISHRSKASRDGAALHPVQRRSSSTTASSAATARRDRSARRSRCSTKRARARSARQPPTCRRTVRVELTDDEIRERMSGNLCRCGAYVGIVAAVRDAVEGRT